MEDELQDGLTRPTDHPRSDPGRSEGARGERPGRKRVEDLEVFKLAHDLALSVHRASSAFADVAPQISNDLRRAAIAVPSSLAEGSGQPTRAEYRHFVDRAQGVTQVVSYHLLLAKDLGLLPESDCLHLREGYHRVAYMLARFSQSLS